MNYKWLRLEVYNDHPGEDGSYWVTVRLDESGVISSDAFLKRIGAPALHTIFYKLIPDAPELMSAEGKMNPEWYEYQRKYFDAPELSPSEKEALM